jgi:membrane associated rhomboid family serine protease
LFFPLHDQNNEEVKVVPVITYVIIGICFLVHLYQVILNLAPNPKVKYVHFLYQHGLVPKSFFSGTTEYPIKLPDGINITKKDIEDLRNMPEHSPAAYSAKQNAELIWVENSIFWVYMMPLTYMFLHGGWMHFLSNIWFFWIFSDNVEERMGGIKFLFFYLLTGIISGLGHALLNYDSGGTLVGASGAISAVMGAYVVLFPGNRITSYFCPVWFFIRRIDVAAWVVLGMYLLMNFLSLASMQHSNTAFDAHIFGFLAGGGIAFLMNKVSGPNKKSN